MKICAVILDYRGAGKTLTCLNSLKSQGIDTAIVVDNSGDPIASDQLAQVLNGLQKAGTDYTLHVLHPAANLGFAGGVNLALQSALVSHCDVFLLINNDASAQPGVIPLLAAELERSNVDLIAPTVMDDAGIIQHPLYYQRYFGLMTARRLPGSYPFLTGCCLMFRRDLSGTGKLFDEDFFMYGEDTLLGWKLLREKKHMVTAPSAFVRHTGQGTWPPCSLFYEYHMARAHILLATKTWKVPMERPLLLVAKSAGLLARAVRRSIHYGTGLPLKAFFLAWQPRDIRKNQ